MKTWRISAKNAQKILGGSCLPLRRMLVLVLGVLSLGIPERLQAALPQMCIPQPGWVAYLSGPPRWWDGKDQNGVVIPSYDFTDPQWDPRWIGARADGYGGGTTNDARFRTLFTVENGVTYLYMSWFVNVAPTFSQQNTSLYIGLSPTGNNVTGTIFQATFDSDTGNVANGSPEGAQANPEPLLNSKKWTVTLYQGNQTTGWNPLTPAWFTDNTPLATKLTFQNTATAWANPAGNHQWAVNFRIPIDPSGTNGVNIGNATSFKIWYYIQPDLTVIGNTIGYIPYTWPRVTTDVTTYVVTTGLGGLQFPDPNDATNPWGPAALESPSAEVSCKNGVDLEDDAIGTLGPMNTPSSYINPWASNTFFAAPLNYGPQVSANVIHARFRIANWGAQDGDLTSNSWTDIPNLSSVADTIGLTAGTSMSPTTGSITGNVDFTSSDPAIKALHCAIVGQSGIPTANPPVPGDATCPNATPTRDHHECILVSLTGNNVDFIRDSAFHNMDFTQMDFSEPAEVSIVGLPPMAGGRTVVLFLETRNMPSFPSLGYSTPPAPGLRASITGAAARVNSVFSAAVQYMPTYIVHAYYDTGKTVTFKNVKYPLYQPLTSFGYFVQHKGITFGWRPRIEGAAEIAPGYYKLTVPSNGTVKITSTITAVDFTTWWIWLLLIVILLIIVLIGWLIGRSRREVVARA